MKLNRIKLKNFRSFGGEHDIDLNIKESKNIILIGGKNGAGKSSLFEGMKLCLYGPLTFGYMNQNHYYIEKIKSNINNDSLK
ncbi:MAG: AAA family ATPase, partial [Bacillota bacterium]|nr:AAA family ATPase [Bacillota bacterium]